MKTFRLVFGLYDATAKDCNPGTRAWLRDISLSWARFGYQGPVIEGAGAEAILAEAAELGYEYCLLLASGTVVDENWYPPHWGRRDLHTSLEELMDDADFLAAGRPHKASSGSFQIDDHCLLVNLKRYVSSGQPTFQCARLNPIETSASEAKRSGGAASWRIADAPNGSGATFRAFDPTAALAIVDLLSPRGNTAGVEPYLGRQILDFPANETAPSPVHTAAQRRVLAKVRRQIMGTRRGVFPLNYEPYDDVELPPPGLMSPLKSVYGVGAGFKPYRIMQTHGYDRDTRLVLYDYSPRALEFRQRQLREWDGADYPGFVRKAFREMPPDTYFWLWADLSPDEAAMSDLEQVWKAETDRWGGPKEFQKHWTVCRSLPHEFVVCDLTDDPWPLLERIRDEQGAAIWWSNAFFTVYSNWFFTIAERRQRYLRFIKGLAETAPGLFLYGTDHMNSSVNSIRADEYASSLAREAGDGLMPAQFHRLQIRS